MSEWTIELRGITRRYPRFALRDVDRAVSDGAALGVVGPNGAFTGLPPSSSPPSPGGCG